MTTTGPGVHYPHGITGGTHPGGVADCPIAPCVQRRQSSPATDPQRDRTRLLHLLDRLRDGRLLTAEVDLLADAVTAALTARDADRVALIEAIELPDGATWDRIVVAAAALQRAATAASRDAEALRADRELWVQTYGEEIALHAAEARRYRAAWHSARRRARKAEVDAELRRLATLHEVQGHCPACGGTSLFLGDGGYVTCSRLDCPQPDAASSLLDRNKRP